ncbi:uncharacterized protein LOC142759003 isoform X3 [Rhinoderma darwinii]|uniref:uncharacterized protein LOC142759003 isoform X3 n=1 Tax=Rhinoderma darwinii TaxID=43563 RepID=UPI003F66A91A
MSVHTYPVSVTFHDVAACFSAEEWGRLEDWQKTLYKKVMLEIHTALEAMGFEILNRDVLFRIKKVKELYIDICEMDRAVGGAASSPRDPGRIMGPKQERGAHLDYCHRKGAKSTAHPACRPDLLLRIKQEEASCFSNQTQPSPPHSGGAEPIVTSVFSLQRDKEEFHPADRSEGRIISAHRMLSSQTIKQEKVDYVTVSAGDQGSDGTTATPRGRPSSQPMKRDDLDYMKVSVCGPGSDSTGATPRGQVTKPIKHEEPEYIKVPVGGQGPVITTVPSKEPIECVHPEAPVVPSFSPQCQDAAEDSNRDSSEEPSVISPDGRPHPSDVMEERATAPEAEPETRDRHFSAMSSTLHHLTSHQRESNLLMQEQNAILSQIAYSLNLLQIQQTDGLAALGNIIQQGIEVLRPASRITPNDRTTEHPNVHAGLRRQVMNINRADQPVPQKRKIT